MNRYCWCGHEEQDHTMHDHGPTHGRMICIACETETCEHEFEPVPTEVESGRERLTV